MARRSSLIPLAALLCTFIAGCGGDSERAMSSADAKATAAPANLEQYLMRDNEVPGLEPLESPPRTDSGPPFELPEDGAERLRGSGYISTTFQPAEGDRSAGVSSVLLFETEAGARDWMAYETSDEAIQQQIPGATIQRFQVVDVPGAHGWTGPDLHGNAIGHVYWTQGRCMMLIGLEVEGPRVERLSATATAIYERTGWHVPGLSRVREGCPRDDREHPHTARSDGVIGARLEWSDAWDACVGSRSGHPDWCTSPTCSWHRRRTGS